VHVEVETTAKALRKADHSAAELNAFGGSRRDLTPSPLDLPAVNLSDEDAPYGAQRPRILGEEEAELEGNAEHPLAEWHVREHVVCQMGRSSAHAPRVAEGQTPRRLHEKATSNWAPHAEHRARRKP